MLREWDLNPRSAGYGPAEIPNFSTPRIYYRGKILFLQDARIPAWKWLLKIFKKNKKCFLFKKKK